MIYMVVKQTFLKSLYEWMVLLSSHSFSGILDFIDCYNFSLFGVIQMRFDLLVKLGVPVLASMSPNSTITRNGLYKLCSMYSRGRVD